MKCAIEDVKPRDSKNVDAFCWLSLSRSLNTAQGSFQQLLETFSTAPRTQKNKDE